MVSDIEVLVTTAENIGLADQVTAVPGLNEQLGAVLTFQTGITGMFKGFVVETLQPGAGFTFNDDEGGFPVTGFQNALSVGENDDYEYDIMVTL